MMYVVKVGNMCVKRTELIKREYAKTLYIDEVVLSKEIMQNFDKNMAELVANEINGEVVELLNEVTRDDDKYKQLNIFDMEVKNGN